LFFARVDALNPCLPHGLQARRSNDGLDGIAATKGLFLPMLSNFSRILRWSAPVEARRTRWEK
jgi:hypothetical protein